MNSVGRSNGGSHGCRGCILGSINGVWGCERSRSTRCGVSVSSTNGNSNIGCITIGTSNITYDVRSWEFAYGNG